MIKQIPILFSTAMVQAILEGRKTMTRRVIKPQPEDGLHNDTLMPRSIDSELKGWNGVVDATGESKEWKCPYGEKGDVLWVRESWARFEYDGEIAYKSGFIRRYGGWERDVSNRLHDIERVEKWRPSIHMPKAIARIWLEVVNVRVERLHDISEEDAQAEGMEQLMNITGFPGIPQVQRANPWVWVVEFKVLSTTGKPEIA